jgi:hypothetical protein
MRTIIAPPNDATADLYHTIKTSATTTQDSLCYYVPVARFNPQRFIIVALRRYTFRLSSFVLMTTVLADLSKEGDQACRKAAARDEIARDEIARDEIARDEIARDEIARDEIARDEIARDEIARDEIAPTEGSITPATKRVKLGDNDFASDTAATVTPEASCHKSTDAEDRIPATAPCCGMTERETKDLLLREAGYNADSSVAVPKRTDYLSWDDYFMATAVLSSLRSKDPTNPSGCCIVDSRNRIIGIGYNGFPMNCSDDVLPWTPASSGAAFLHTCDPVSP